MKYLCPKCNKEVEVERVETVIDELVVKCKDCRETYIILIMPYEEYMLHRQAMEAFTGKTLAQRKAEFLAQPDKRTLSNDRDLAEFKQAFFDGKLDKYMGKDK